MNILFIDIINNHFNSRESGDGRESRLPSDRANPNPNCGFWTGKAGLNVSNDPLPSLVHTRLYLNPMTSFKL